MKKLELYITGKGPTSSGTISTDRKIYLSCAEYGGGGVAASLSLSDACSPLNSILARLALRDFFLTQINTIPTAIAMTTTGTTTPMAILAPLLRPPFEGVKLQATDDLSSGYRVVFSMAARKASQSRLVLEVMLMEVKLVSRGAWTLEMRQGISRSV